MKPRLRTAGWGLSYSKYGLWSGSIDIIWELVTDAESAPEFPNDDLKSHSSQLIPVHVQV